MGQVDEAALELEAAQPLVAQDLQGHTWRHPSQLSPKALLTCPVKWHLVARAASARLMPPEGLDMQQAAAAAERAKKVP